VHPIDPKKPISGDKDEVKDDLWILYEEFSTAERNLAPYESTKPISDLQAYGEATREHSFRKTRLEAGRLVRNADLALSKTKTGFFATASFALLALIVHFRKEIKSMVGYEKE